MIISLWISCAKVLLAAMGWLYVDNCGCIIGLGEILEKMNIFTLNFASFVFWSKIQLFWFKAFFIRKNGVLSLAKNTKDFKN